MNHLTNARNTEGVITIFPSEIIWFWTRTVSYTHLADAGLCDADSVDTGRAVVGASAPATRALSVQAEYPDGDGAAL